MMPRLRLMAEIIKLLDETEMDFLQRGAIIGLVETAWNRMEESDPWWRKIFNRLSKGEKVNDW